MRLIDADALKKALEWIDGNPYINFDKEIMQEIDNAPTVELFCHYQYDGEVKEPCVEGPCPHERPQGEWIYEEHTKFLDGGGRILCRGYKCSNCGFFRHRKRGMSKYCEECGAKMEECQDDSISGNDTAKS